MKIFGIELRRSVPTVKKELNPISSGYGRGWYRVMESFAGAWQSNVTIDRDTVLSYSAVYACVTLISQDIGKLRMKVVQQNPNTKIWKEVDKNEYSDLLRKPNDFQNRIKFLEYWITSKLLHGNTYALKIRERSGKVAKLYILDPSRVTPLVSTDGSVYYQLRTDALAELDMDMIVPASEIIHDTMLTLFHPLVGVTPIYACGLAATQGINIQRNAAKFFGNQSQPGGILVAPGDIAPETASALKEYWENNFTGDNAGKIAVVGDGLKYEALTMKASDAQLVDQLRISAETVCACFHVPPFMVGAAPLPSLTNVEALTQQYYNQCLQSLIESFEECMTNGLELGERVGIELDLDALFRMDTLTRYGTYEKGIGSGWLKPNEARAKEDLEPVEGGDTPYMQQQNYSLAALNKRDQKDPLSQPESPPPQAPSDDEEDDDEEEESVKALLSVVLRGLDEMSEAA